MENKKPRNISLKVGETEIGEIVGSYKNEVYTFHIYYGNYVLPSCHGEFIHYNNDLYRKMLEQFLNSNAGSMYLWPSEEEIAQATQMVIAKESQLINKQKLDAPKEVADIKENSPKQESDTQTIEDSQEVDERVKRLFVVVIVQFLCIVGLVLLRFFNL